MAFLPASRAAECSNLTLSGKYLHTFNGFGYQPPQHSQTTALSGAFVAAGVTEFDAVTGSFTWRDDASLGGLILAKRELQGAYHLDPMTCVVALTAPGILDPFAELVVSPDGKELYFLNTFNSVRITGIFHQRAMGDCSALSMTGTYRSLLDGYEYRGSAPIGRTAAGRAFGQIGRLAIKTEMDGSGTFEWRETTSIGGEIQRRVLRGTHVLTFSDCRASASIQTVCIAGSCSNLPVGSSTASFAVSPGGDEMVFVNTTAGTAVNGRLYKQ
jgi:hypothetical protein